MQRQTAPAISPTLTTVMPVDGGGVEGAGRDRSGDVEGEELTATEVQDKVEADETTGEESVLRRALPSPYMPTISEIRLHKTTHLPYRSWCDECVEAFAREWPHLRGEPGGSGRSIPIVHMDYAWLTERGLVRPAEISDEERRNAVQLLVGYCGASGTPFVHVVPSKANSVDRYAAERVVEDIVYLGHTRVVLRSDNEPALVQLVSDALKGLRVQQLDSAAAEGSVPYDPQTAGSAEV